MHSRPDTRPMPAIIPAPGASSWYMPFAASWPISSRGEPGSSSRVTRSRGSSLPRATCRSRCLSGPPSAALATWLRSSSASARLCAAKRRKVSAPSSIFEVICAINNLRSGRACRSPPLLFLRGKGRKALRQAQGERCGCAYPSCVHRLLADQVAINADHVDAEQDDVLGADPGRLVGDEAPGDKRDRRAHEDHERPA